MTKLFFSWLKTIPKSRHYSAYKYSHLTSLPFGERFGREAMKIGCIRKLAILNYALGGFISGSNFTS